MRDFRKYDLTSFRKDLEELHIHLTEEELAYLEECYVPHPIVGAIKENPPQGVVLLDAK